MEAKFEWNASENLRRQEAIATGEAGSLFRSLVVKLANIDQETRRRILALTRIGMHGGLDPIKANVAYEPDAAARARERGDNGMNTTTVEIDHEPNLEEVLAIAEKFALDRAAVEAANREYRDEQQRARDEAAALRATAKARIDELAAAGDLAGLRSFTMPGAHFGDIQEAIRDTTNALFQSERTTWIEAHGSPHLRRCQEEGYNCLRLYVLERAAMEAAGWIVDFDDNAEWADRACPSPSAIEVVDAARAAGLPDPIVVWLKVPPRGKGEYYEDDFKKCEAVVVRRWLHRYDLVRIW